jgi:hexulose-6-phosphate isomerase
MMNDILNRRSFLKETGIALAVAAAAGSRPIVAAETSQTPTGGGGAPIAKKALKLGMVKQGDTLLEKFRVVKDVGFDGIDMDGPPQKHADVLKARDETGLFIHGVVDNAHWSQPLSHPDPKVRQAGLDGLLTALRDAKAYGGDTVLLVPAVVNKETSYADAYTRSQAEIRKALPLAKELGIKIAIENVWNMFLLSPLEMARYIDEFESPLVGSYFDVGNIVNYGWPEQWIHVLGKRIMKVDIKEYSRKKRDTNGPSAGFGVPIGEGDCDWPAVLKALSDVGYSGWGTAEVSGGDRDRLKDIADRMDRYLEM